MNRKEAKYIAGRVLVKEFEREFLIENIEKLHLTECLERNKLVISFLMFKSNINDFEEVNTTEKGITVEEKDFPDILLTVTVDLKNGETEIIYKNRDIKQD